MKQPSGLRYIIDPQRPLQDRFSASLPTYLHNTCEKLISHRYLRYELTFHSVCFHVKSLLPFAYIQSEESGLRMHFYRSEWPSVRAHFYDVSQIPSPKAAAKHNLPIFVDREGPPQGTFLLSILIFHCFSSLVGFFVCLPLSILVYTCLHLSIFVYSRPQLSQVIHSCP